MMRLPSNWPNTVLPIVFLAVVSLGMLAPAGLSAQQFFVQRPAGADRDKSLYDQFTQQLDQKKKAAENRMQVRLADIDHACQLTDAQRKKLTIASKGAVKSHMTKAIKVVKTTARQVGFDFEPDNPPEAVEKDDDDEEEEKGNVARAANVFVMRGVAGLGMSSDAVEKEKIWTNSVKKTLTDQQTEKFESWQDQRKSLLEKAAVDNFVARVDLKLLLSPRQREKLTNWIDENYSEQLAARLEAASPPQRIFRLNGLQNTPRISVVKAPLATILSEPQRQAWSESFQSELDGLGGLAGLNRMAIPAIRVLPAPIVVEEDDN